MCHDPTQSLHEPFKDKMKNFQAGLIEWRYAIAPDPSELVSSAEASISVDIFLVFCKEDRGGVFFLVVMYVFPTSPP